MHQEQSTYEGLQNQEQEMDQGFEQNLHFPCNARKDSKQMQNEILLEPWIKFKETNNLNQLKWNDTKKYIPVQKIRRKSYDQKLEEMFMKYNRNDLIKCKNSKADFEQGSARKDFKEHLQYILQKGEVIDCKQFNNFQQIGKKRIEDTEFSSKKFKAHLSSSLYRCDYRKNKIQPQNDIKIDYEYKGNSNLQRMLKMKEKLRKRNSSLVTKVKDQVFSNSKDISCKQAGKYFSKQISSEEMMIFTHADREKAKMKIKFRNRENMKKYSSDLAILNNTEFISVKPVKYSNMNIGINTERQTDKVYHTSIAQRDKSKLIQLLEAKERMARTFYKA